MSIEALLNGESRNVEYKLLPPSRSINYTKTAVAFANGQGGCLVFGVEDQTLRVAGIAEDKVFTVMDAISDAIVNSCEPLIIPDITMHDVNGKTVIVVEIAPCLQRPYHIKSLGQEQGTFVRVAGTTRQADQPTILTIEGSNRSLDQVQCLGLSVTDEDIANLCASLTKTAKDNAEDSAKVKTVTEKQLLQWGVLCEQDGTLTPTNAYAILTGNEAVRSVVQCGVFKGTTKAVFVDRREFAGTPQELIEESYQYVLRNIHMGARFRGVYRQDVYEIPPDAIRELIVNAIVHRSYIDHSSIQIAIYDDRLEITSPGRLPMGQTIERMKQGYSKIRNEALAAAFEYMGYIEHWGSGILRVMQQVRDAGLPEPEFLGGDTDLRINIYRAGMAVSSENVAVRESARTNTDECAQVRDNVVGESSQTKRIMELLSGGEMVSREQVEKALGVKKRRAQILLNELIEKNLVVRVGESRQTRYKAMGNGDNT